MNDITGLKYRLVLEEPVLATGVMGEPNSSVSLNYIPGSMLRGALVGLWKQSYLKEHSEAELPVDLAVHDEFRRLFLNGDTRYLHLNLMIDERRVVPAAQCWYEGRDKQTETIAYEDALFDALTLKKPKPLRGWVREQFEAALEGSDDDAAGRPACHKLVIVQADRQINLHTQRDATRGRATEEGGAVFRYDALPAGLILEGVIFTTTASDSDKLQALLAGQTLLLGGARTAGYGRVRVQATEILSADWQEVHSPQLDADQVYSEIIVRCLSDVLVRDRYGSFTVALDEVLVNLLGVEISCLKREDGTSTAVFCDDQLIGGFDRTWGLPLTQSIAIGAGSIFALGLGEPVRGEKLLQLVRAGLGERRTEGFGRIAIVPRAQWPGRLETSRPVKFAKDSGEVTSSSKAAEQIQHMLKRVWLQALDSNLQRAVNEIDIAGAVPNSQLSLWRTQVRGARGTTATLARPAQIDRLLKFWEDKNQKRNEGWQALEQARVRKGANKAVLTVWLRELLQSNTKTLEQAQQSKLGGWLSLPQAPVLGEHTLKLLPKMLDEAKLRLIEAVLARKSKQQSTGSKQTNKGATQNGKA